MAADKTSWNCLPPEIRNEIIRLLPILGGKCSQLVTVCKAWQSIIEPLNFAEIILTVPRLTELDSRAVLFRKRHQIRCICFQVDLDFDHRFSALTDQDPWTSHDPDDEFMADAFERLFTTLNKWEPRGDLTLDTSVYFPCDIRLWFKHFRFCPDTSLAECPSRHGQEQGTTLHDPVHGWVAESFNGPFPERWVPTPEVSQKLARASLFLTRLSGSFMADAGHFSAAHRDLWTWKHLTPIW
ncbi:hypothetical protein BM221_003527 [Beauveria bassiana]|uniref:DUF6546 domain-containing protein n=1 Tax=Beauveria bassiana TaxID=176275 RepID=A0A2N6NUW4_BEABA|nr:hypothetical protein BM221_003527 [Beauveria bassiana]